MSNRRKSKGATGRKAAQSSMRKVPGRFTLRIIPEPKEGTRTVFNAASADSDFVFVEGALEGIEYACGNCGRTLMRGVARGQISNVVLCCPTCGQFNDTGP